MINPDWPVWALIRENTALSYLYERDSNVSLAIRLAATKRFSERATLLTIIWTQNLAHEATRWELIKRLEIGPSPIYVMKEKSNG